MRTPLPILIVACLALLAGCNGKSASRHVGTVVVELDEKTGLITRYEVKGDSASSAEAAPNAQEPSSTEAGFGISRANASGSWQAAPIDWAAKNTGWLYIIGSLALIGGMVVGVWLKQKTLGIAIGIAGAVLIAAPSQLDNLGWMLTGSVGVLLLGAFAWIAIQLFRKQKAAEIAPAVVAKLREARHAPTMEQTNVAIGEATTLIRTISSPVDKAYEAATK